MRAVSIGEDRRLEPAELDERALAGEEVRVKVAFCGICGSDLHLRASPAVAPGTVMGHEFSGEVSEVGPAVEDFAVGDRVAVFPFVPCGACPSCSRGDYHVCQEAATGGLGLGARPGAYAESVVVHRAMLIRIPSELSLEHAALVEPLAVALHALNVGEVRETDRCVVIGAGPIGMLTALALVARGVKRPLVIEKNERRQERMRSFGIDAIGSDDVHLRVLEELSGDLPDVVLECAGNRAAPQLAIELVRPRGVIVLVGVLEEPVEISQLVLLIKEAQIRGSFAYRHEDFEEAIGLLVSSALPADRLITDAVPLERAQEMFERLEDPATDDIKILLNPRLG